MLPTTSEKGIGAPILVPPYQARSSIPQDFLPTYEQHMNENLRNFDKAEAQAKRKELELEGQMHKKRRLPAFRKYWCWLVLLNLLIIIGIVLAAEWWNGAFKKHGQDEQSALSTRSEVIITAAPVTATVVMTVIETTPIETVTSTKVMEESPASTDSSTLAFLPPMTVTPQSTSTAVFDSTASTSSASMPPVTTTLISVTTAPTTIVTARLTPSTTSIASARGGFFYACGVPHAACG